MRVMASTAYVRNVITVRAYLLFLFPRLKAFRSILLVEKLPGRPLCHPQTPSGILLLLDPPTRMFRLLGAFVQHQELARLNGTMLNSIATNSGAYSCKIEHAHCEGTAPSSLSGSPG